jgi:predicted RNase H-like HicB family nuclease
MQYTCSVVLSQGDERGFVVEVPTLPGCVTFGATLSEALLNAEEAIGLYLQMLTDDGEPIPQEGTEITVSVDGKRELIVRYVTVALPEELANVA